MARSSRSRRSTTSVEERQEQVTGLVAQIGEKVDALVNGEQWRAMLDTATRFHRYSFNNLMLIAMQADLRGFVPTQVAGFQRWKEFGRSVRKGEKGLQILAPVVRKFSVDDEDAAKGKPDQTASTATSTATSAGASAERTVRRVVGFRVTYVWDISQTDGEPLSAGAPGLTGGSGGAVDVMPKPLVGAGDDELRAAIDDLIGAAGYTVREGRPTAGANGHADPQAREVVIRETNTPAQKLKTAVHEYAHILLGHVDDLADYQQHQGIAETEAESVAYVVLGALGIDTSDYSIPYVASWTSGDRDQVRATAERVTRCAHRILAALDPTGDQREDDRAEASTKASTGASGTKTTSRRTGGSADADQVMSLAVA